MATDPVNIKVSVDTSQFTASLYTLARIYDIGAQVLAYPQMVVTPPKPDLIYAERTWADLNIERLGWALLGAVFFWLSVR